MSSQKYLRIWTDDGTLTQTAEPPSEADAQMVDAGELQIIRLGSEHGQIEEFDGTTNGLSLIHI